MTRHPKADFFPMSLRFAWANAFQSRRRVQVAIASIACSILLMFLQLGFFLTARRAHTLLYELLDFDLTLTSNRFESLKNTGAFPVGRLYQVRALDGVADVARLNVDWADWLNPLTAQKSSLMLIGIDLNPSFIRDQRISEQMEALRPTGTLLVDNLSSSSYGSLASGSRAGIRSKSVRIVGQFSMGTDFKAAGRAIVNQGTYYSVKRENGDAVCLGLIKLKPGADLTRVKTALRASLPPDVLLFDRQSLITDEEDYYTIVKPIGFFFQAGWILAFIVGAVVLFQTLATDITWRFREFATLKAIGMRSSFLYASGMFQAGIYGLLAYLPALVVASVLFYTIQAVTSLPMQMSFSLAVFVLGLSLFMCILSGVLALIRVRRADPASLL